MKKMIPPVGYEDLKEIIEKGLYYVDKSLMIRELLDSAGKVTLLTRPRRFGKTLNLSMIRRFFEDERNIHGERIDNRQVFKNLAISRCRESYQKHQQQYPVISLSLKSAKQKKFEDAYAMLKKQISEEFRRHSYVLDGNRISKEEKDSYWRIMERTCGNEEYLDALHFLCKCLNNWHGKKAIILIDEYDVPLENAYMEGFYEEMVAFLRSIFESALKTNNFLEFAVITGCLRISRESIFTGLNNLEIHSVLSHRYDSCFGFTEDEVKAMLHSCGLSEKYPELKAWYDGYCFGSREIYNPWSIVNYVKNAEADSRAFPRPYWSNTSSNDIIRQMIENADEETRSEIERLMEGDTVEKPIHEEITYDEIHSSRDNLWNFLFFTGYLKSCGQRQDDSGLYLQMAIPNNEVRGIYRQSILKWFEHKVADLDRGVLIKALENGDCETAGKFLSEQLMDTISYFDYAENYYHGFLAGLLKGAGNYQVQSDRESGSGRPDLILKEKKFMGKAMVLEVKIARRFDEMEAKCEEALTQIKENHYAEPLLADGYRPVLSYGICFFKKGCIVKKGEAITRV